MHTMEEQLIAELKSIPTAQGRIDIIAADIESGTRRFSAIDVYILGELLNLDFEDGGNWPSHTGWAWRPKLDDWDFASNLDRIIGLIPESRYAELEKQANCPGAPDPVITSEEESLMIKQLEAESLEDCVAFVSEETSLTASSGFEIRFTQLVGCAGERSAARGPYDDNMGFDESKFVAVEHY